MFTLKLKMFTLKLKMFTLKMCWLIWITAAQLPTLTTNKGTAASV